MVRQWLTETLDEVEGTSAAFGDVSQARRVLALFVDWTASTLVAALAVWAVTFVLMGRAFALYSILAHEGAHRLLFSNRKLNDTVARWGLGFPAFVPLDPFTVNLADREAERYAQVGITLELAVWPRSA